MKRKSKNLRYPTWPHQHLPAVAAANFFFAWFLACLLASSAFGQAPSEFVDVQALEPTIAIDLRYATADNFVHRAVYPPSARCYLRVPVAERLQAVQRELRAQGLGLKLFDCYRPRPVQRLLWAVVPDERYVAHPDKGSRHNRGAAVDLTLVDKAGRELPMPTPFDDFTEKAHRDYRKLPPEVLANRQRLEAAMGRHGFVPMPTEWWHFDGEDAGSYPLDDVGFETLAAAAPPGEPEALAASMLADDLRLLHVKYLSPAVARLEAEQAGRRFAVKWKPMGPGGSERQEGYEGNNAPRCELGAYRLWRLLGLGEGGVPPVVLRAFHRDVPCARACARLPRLVSRELPATFPELNDHLVLGALSQWIEPSRTPLHFDGDLWNGRRFAERPDYRRSMAELLPFLFLIAHGDPNSGRNFLLGLPSLGRIYSVDNGRAFDGLPEAQVEPEGAPLRRLAPGTPGLVVPAIRRRTLERLQRLTAESLREQLLLVAAVDLETGQAVPSPAAEPRLAALAGQPLSGVPGLWRRSRQTYTGRVQAGGPPWLLLGISERGVADVLARAQRLVRAVQEGQLGLLDE